MKRLVIFAAALGAVIVMAGVASAQTAPPPVANPAAVGPSFVDANGDGICDNCTGTGQGQGKKARKGTGGNGPGNGTGNQGVSPRDGSGFGPGARSGNCTGTGPKGQGRGRRGGRS